MLASARPARSIATVLSPASAARALVTRAAAALPGSDASASGRSSPAVVTSSRCASRAVSRRGLRGERVISRAGKKGSKGGGAASGLLSGVHPDSVEAVARIVEKAQAASDQWRVETTAFLDPALAADALMCLERAADVAAFPWGGHARAERVRIITGRPETLGEPWEEGGGDEALGDEALGDAAAASASSKGAAPPADSFARVGLGHGRRGGFSGCARELRVRRRGPPRLPRRGAWYGHRAGQNRRHLRERRARRGGAVRARDGVVFTIVPRFGAFRARDVRRRAALESAPPREERRVFFHRSVHATGRGGLRGVQDEPLEDERAHRRGRGARELARGVQAENRRRRGDVISLRGKGRVEVGDVSETKKGKFQVELVRYL